MVKKVDVVLVVISLAVVTSLYLLAIFMGMPVKIPPRLWANRPASVGNKPAPIPVLDVEKATLSPAGEISLAQARSAIASFLGNQGITPTYSLQEYQLNWLLSVEDGSLSPVEADVFVPIGSPGQQFPVIIYGAGTTGLDDRCAPSREDLRDGNMGNYRNHMISQASQGYVVVMPNYEGLDNPDRTQNYFNKDNEARTILGAAEALISSTFQANLPINALAIFLGGYSQGGHAAFSAADYAETYVPDIKIAGVFGHGPTTDTIELLKNNPNLAPYFFTSYSEFYPVVNPAEILSPAWLAQLENARTLCVNEAFHTNSTNVQSVYTAPFKTALLNNTLDTAFPAVYEVLQENDAGTSYTNIPSMIVQGTTDPIVTSAAQDAFIAQLCQRGVNVEVKRYPGLHHFQTRQESFSDTNAWIDAITRGETTVNTCESL